WIFDDIDKLSDSFTHAQCKPNIRGQKLHPKAIYTSRLIPYLSNTPTVHIRDDLFAS
ncbi:5438_t:CDS:1, partial [Ambispora gerdemannii]